MEPSLGPTAGCSARWASLSQSGQGHRKPLPAGGALPPTLRASIQGGLLFLDADCFPGRVWPVEAGNFQRLFSVRLCGRLRKKERARRLRPPPAWGIALHNAPRAGTPEPRPRLLPGRALRSNPRFSDRAQSRPRPLPLPVAHPSSNPAFAIQPGARQPPEMHHAALKRRRRLYRRLCVGRPFRTQPPSQSGAAPLLWDDATGRPQGKQSVGTRRLWGWRLCKTRGPCPEDLAIPILLPGCKGWLQSYAYFPGNKPH